MSRPDELDRNGNMGHRRPVLPLDFAIRAQTNADTIARIAARRQEIRKILEDHYYSETIIKCACGLECESWAAHVEELLREFTEPQ